MCCPARDFQEESDKLEVLIGARFDEIYFCFPVSQATAQGYGDVVCLDTTHYTNDARLKLCSSWVGDGAGSTHTIRLHLFAKEDAASIGAAVTF